MIIMGVLMFDPVYVGELIFLMDQSQDESKGWYLRLIAQHCQLCPVFPRSSLPLPSMAIGDVVLSKNQTALIIGLILDPDTDGEWLYIVKGQLEIWSASSSQLTLVSTQIQAGLEGFISRFRETYPHFIKSDKPLAS